MNKIIVSNGEVNNGSLIRVCCEVPMGMRGRELKRWKKNEERRISKGRRVK